VSGEKEGRERRSKIAWGGREEREREERDDILRRIWEKTSVPSVSCKVGK
jgi:hypothetical protein